MLHERRAVALLCPGPSITQYPGREGYSRVVAVNRACEYAECDDWVFLDARCWRLFKPRGFSRVASTLGAIRQCGNWGMVAAHYDVKALPVGYKRLLRFSAVAGLALAATCGDEVHCYGVDWSGVNDWDDGEPHRTRLNRTAQRWKREREVWEKAVRVAESGGVRVVHAREGLHDAA